MPVEWSQGSLRVRHSPLVLDARRRSPLAFVSHAHGDHIARHHTVLATRETLALLQHRVGAVEEPCALDFGQQHTVGELTVELFPAGHVLGAAQVRVTRPDGHRLVYTGDFCLEPGLTCGAAVVVPCDTLVMEATFGHPRYHFPPRERVYDAVARWARTQAEEGRQAVLVAYSLGKSQEAICQLSARGLKLCAHPHIEDIARLYTALGTPVPVRRFEGALEADEVGVFPPFRVPALERPARVAALSGWALESWGARRAGADVAFPISDHSDFPGLMRYARESGAREVIPVFGFAQELARELNRAGLFARGLSQPVQLGLALGVGGAL